MSLQSIKMSSQNFKMIQTNTEIQTNASAYYKANYRYTSMQHLDKYSSDSK